jgi:hypothetical protein
MDLSSFKKKLTDEERAKRIAEGRCLYCGGFNHVARFCPVKPKTPLRGNEGYMPTPAPSVTPSLPAYSRPPSPGASPPTGPKPAEN